MSPEGNLAHGDENEGAKAIRKALGVGDYEQVRVLTPQFERTDGKVITWFPECAEDRDTLKPAPAAILRDIGMQVWDSTDSDTLGAEEKRNIAKHGFKGTLWLFPAEWFDHIPEGYPVISVFWEKRPHDRKPGCNDPRYGALFFGFIGPDRETK